VKRFWNSLSAVFSGKAGSLLGSVGGRLRWPDPETDSRRVNTTLGMLAVGNLLVFLIFTDPMYQLREVRVAEWEALSHRIGQRQRSVERMERQRERLEQQRENLVRFHDDILSDKFTKLTTIQREIRDLATQFQINPENISYTPDYVKDQELVNFGISFPLRGSYENLRQFIHRVESSPHFLIIDDITLSDAREGGVVLSLNIRLRTFFQDVELGDQGEGRS
jgi:Tfp pilus assembly protein PilO